MRSWRASQTAQQNMAIKKYWSRAAIKMQTAWKKKKQLRWQRFPFKCLTLPLWLFVDKNWELDYQTFFPSLPKPHLQPCDKVVRMRMRWCQHFRAGVHLVFGLFPITLTIITHLWYLSSALNYSPLPKSLKYDSHELLNLISWVVSWPQTISPEKTKGNRTEEEFSFAESFIKNTVLYSYLPVSVWVLDRQRREQFQPPLPNRG